MNKEYQEASDEYLKVRNVLMHRCERPQPSDSLHHLCTSEASSNHSHHYRNKRSSQSLVFLQRAGREASWCRARLPRTSKPYVGQRGFVTGGVEIDHRSEACVELVMLDLQWELDAWSREWKRRKGANGCIDMLRAEC